MTSSIYICKMVTKRLQFTQSCKANTTRRYSNYVLQFRLRFPAEAAVRLFRQVLKSMHIKKHPSTARRGVFYCKLKLLHSFRHGHSHGHGSADHGVVAHALFEFLRHSTFFQIFPAAIVLQGFSHMVTSNTSPLFTTFFYTFPKKCGQNVDKNSIAFDKF